MKLKSVHVPRGYEGLHCEVEGAIVNIWTGLHDQDGRAVTRVEVIADQYASEAIWTIPIDGKAPARSISFRVVRGWACEECHRPISEVQAGLSRLRWDGAPPACQDCCTAYLTRKAKEIARFERHRARDPHCTCNDCIAAHFERPPARCRACGVQAGEPTTREPWTCPDCLDAGN